MYTPGRSAATTITGWGMVLGATAAVGASLWGVSPYPPLVPELVLAGVAVLFAVGWVVASYRAAGRDDDPYDKPYRETRSPNPALPYLFAFGIPFAAVTAFLTVFTGSSDYGRETERLERAGYDEYAVTVVRLADEPEFHEGDQDHDPYYLTDLTLRIPYEDGPREVTVPAMYTRYEPPVPGTEVDVYFAPRDPEAPVAENAERYGSRGIVMFAAAVWGGPWVLIAGGIMKSQMDEDDLHKLRRFRPRVHLPALGILLAGVVLLLPMALEFQVSGFDRLPAFLAAFTPPLALTWVARTA
ncbi:hypothetical protein ABZ318_26800 [Streptomyces sp. NPDC006197]|uniref:hypothetical protein n=1 Tax=Streptomyces sp. NPDC006197 TaxID=3156685 RepID=UPI0033BD0E00